VGTAHQKPALNQIPHKKSRKANAGGADQQKNERIQSVHPKVDQSLQDGPMNNVHPVRIIAMLGEVSKIAPEAEDEYHSGDPDNI